MEHCYIDFCELKPEIWRTASRLPLVCALLVLVAANSLAETPTGIQTAACSEVNPGIIVESVAQNSQGEKTGLTAGDVIFAWSIGDEKGELRSPFDLMEVETEQGPRGQVTLSGLRSGSTSLWVMKPGRWGLTTTPRLTGTLLDIYNEGLELAHSDKLADAVQRWRTAGLIAERGRCGWLGVWLSFYTASVLTTSRRWKEADSFYTESLQRATQAKANSAMLVAILLARSRLFEQQSDLPNAEKYQTQALEESQKIGSETLVGALAFRGLGATAMRRGDLLQAEEYFEKALRIQEKLAPSSLDFAATLNNLGAVASDRGELTKAEEYHRRALALREKLDPGGLAVAASLNNLGNVTRARGDLAEAEQYYEQALAIKRSLSVSGLELAFSLNNLGILADDRGDFAAAEDYHQRALAIRKKLAPGTPDEASSLVNLGSVAQQRGDLSRASDYYKQALAIYRKHSPSSLWTAATLGNLGLIASDLDNPVQAEEYYHEAVAIQEKVVPDSLDLAHSFSLLGELAQRRGDLKKAEEYFQRVSAIEEKVGPHNIDSASNLNDLGRLARQRGDLIKAENSFRAAMELGINVARGNLHYAESVAALASTLRELGKNEEAAQLYADALTTFDRELATFGGSPDLRSKFRAQYKNYYYEYADLLISQNKPEQAFDVMERFRARTLLEMLAVAHVDIRQGADPVLIEKEHLLQATLKAKTNRKIDLLGGDHTPEQLAEVDKDIDHVDSMYQELEGQIRASSPKYAALTQPKPLNATEVKLQLDSQTVLLDYALGTEQSHVFVVTPTSLESYELPKRAEVEQMARRTYELLTSRNLRLDAETSDQRKARLAKDEAEYQKTASALSKMVLGAVAKRVEGKRLLIVADGALQYIPFEVLPVFSADTSQANVPLVAKHEIVNLPSASVLALLRQQAGARTTKPTKEVAVLADPVFEKSDPRVVNARFGKSPVNKSGQGVLAAKQDAVSDPGPPPQGDGHLMRSLEDVSGTRQAGTGLPRLVFTRREAAAIIAFTKPGQGMEALDFQASRESATSKDLSQYRIVHFATHGLLNNEHPELSGLVLSLVGLDGEQRDGFLDLEDVYNLTLPADLVVLSACETGLGKEISGEGLVGLTRGFMYAGTSRVVASLWKVDDVATSELMREFYKGMLQDGMRPPAALRQAQLQLRTHKRWHDPYYWAAFTLQGDWR